MPWPQTGETPYHAQLGLTDKGCAMKGLVVCSVVWLGSMSYGMGLWIYHMRIKNRLTITG